MMKRDGLPTQGERDYELIKGGTGPLVYPAGFLYLYTALRWLTGGAILPAQLLFAVLYLANQALVLALYIQAQVCRREPICSIKRMHHLMRATVSTRGQLPSASLVDLARNLCCRVIGASCAAMPSLRSSHAGSCARDYGAVQSQISSRVTMRWRG